MKKIVFFRRGLPESVKSNRLSECLGRVMVRERMISEADCEASLKRMKAEKRQQGTVLIEMGCISPHNLRYALDLQLRLKLLDVFGWTRGEYRFNPKATPPPETVRLEMSPAAIIYEGLRRTFDQKRLDAALGNVAGQYVHPAPDPLFAAQDMGLGEEETGLLAVMDGGKTVRQLRRLGPLSALETDRFLYALMVTGMVELKPERRSLTAPPPRRIVPPAGRADRPWEDDEEVLELEDEVPPDEEIHQRERLLGTLAAMRRMDFFELLGLRHDAPPEAVRQSAVELLRESPDGPALSRRPRRRRPGRGPVPQARRRSSTPSAAAVTWTTLRRGRATTRPGRWAGGCGGAGAPPRGEQPLAAGEMPRPTQRSGGEKLSRTRGVPRHAGWDSAGLPATPGGRHALAMLGQAVEKSPALDRAHLYKGHVHKALGQAAEAQAEYEKAVECNPGCTEALRELSILTWASRAAQRKDMHGT